MAVVTVVAMVAFALGTMSGPMPEEFTRGKVSLSVGGAVGESGSGSLVTSAPKVFYDQ